MLLSMWNGFKSDKNLKEVEYKGSQRHHEVCGVRNELIILKNRSLVEKRAEGVKLKILF